jgi:serine/threonine-protein kinase
VIGVGSKLREYEIVAPLRVGGMASLFLGRRSGAAGFAKLVAIKVVHPHLARDPQFGRMFVDEALISARIEHPNVVHVTELGEQDGAYFLVMEYVHGVTLSQLLAALGKRGRRLSAELAVHIAVRVAEGLHGAHETPGDDGQPLGIVHRDISPQNVLLSSNGHVKLIDFGIAKARGRVQDATTTSLKGKIRYMSPEQAYGRPVDRRTDVYALAIVLWEMLTMRRMFTGDSDFAVLDLVRNPTTPAPSNFFELCTPALDAAVMHALAPAPDARTATAQDFRRELANALPGALALDSSNLGELIVAIMGQELEAERQMISAALHGATGAELAAARPAAPESIENYTMSDGRIRLLGADQVVAQDELRAPVAAPPATPAPMATPAPAVDAPRSRVPMVLGAAVLLLALGGVSGFVALKLTGGSSATMSAVSTGTPVAPVVVAQNPAPVVGTPTPLPAVVPTLPAPALPVAPDAGVPSTPTLAVVPGAPDAPAPPTKVRRPRAPGAGTKTSPGGLGVPMAGSFDD